MAQVDMSLWSLITNADGFVQFILLVLLVASVFSWRIIIQQVVALRQAKEEYQEFEETFWSGTQMSALFRQLDQVGGPLRGLAQCFHTGFKEFLRLQTKVSMSAEAMLEGVERSMHVAVMRERDQLEKGLDWLSIIASVSPYVGLLGTVWGIMHSFRALGNVQQATLSMVAPGIAEALIATAMGLFVAIPAVVAYNRFASTADTLENSLTNFKEEFTEILHREVHAQGEQQ